MRQSPRAIAMLVVAVLAVAGGSWLMQRPSGGTAPAQPPREADLPQDRQALVELSDAKIAAVGIELATAGPGGLHGSLLLNGILQPNQEALVQVTPRFPGIVREVSKRVGDPVTKDDLLARVESNQSLSVYEMKAPISGTVIERHISLGEYASEQKTAFVVADLSEVWVDLSVYRRDLARVHVGDTIMIEPDDGEAPIASRVSYIAPVGASETQSVLARAVVENDRQRLRPGLFVKGRVMLAERPAKVIVKSAAIQYLDNRPVVFVKSGQAFEVRAVDLGDKDTEHVEITDGVASGEVYAARNSFVVKAEFAKLTTID